MESGSSTYHNAAVFICYTAISADAFRSEGAFAREIEGGFVIKIIAWTDLHSDIAVAFYAAKVGIGDTLVAADRVENVVART